MDKSPGPAAAAALENAFAGAESNLGAAGRSWLRRLGGERRVSLLTLDAYARDLRQFLLFLGERF